MTRFSTNLPSFFSTFSARLASARREFASEWRLGSGRALQVTLIIGGTMLLAFGLSGDAAALYEPQARFNDDRIAEATDVMLTYVNGTFGALVMVTAGIFAILSAAFGQYRAALSLLVVAVGSFILRSLVSTWFNDSSLQANSFV